MFDDSAHEIARAMRGGALLAPAEKASFLWRGASLEAHVILNVTGVGFTGSVACGVGVATLLNCTRRKQDGVGARAKGGGLKRRMPSRVLPSPATPLIPSIPYAVISLDLISIKQDDMVYTDPKMISHGHTERRLLRPLYYGKFWHSFSQHDRQSTMVHNHARTLSLNRLKAENAQVIMLRLSVFDI